MKKRRSQIKRANFLIPNIKIVRDPELYLRGLTDTQFKLLKYFFWMDLRVGKIYSTQSHMAEKLGVCRQYINKIIKKFCKDGVLAKVYRYRRSCIYSVSSFFKSYSTRERISSLITQFKIPNLWYLSIKATLVLNNNIKILENGISDIEKRILSYKNNLEMRIKREIMINKKLFLYKKRMAGNKSHKSLFEDPKKKAITTYQLYLNTLMAKKSIVKPVNTIKNDPKLKTNLFKLKKIAEKSGGFLKKILNNFIIPKILTGNLSDDNKRDKKTREKE
jgi:hypothetical protein